MTPVPPLPPDELGDDVRDEARRAIEALVLVGEQPVDTRLLSQLLELAPGVVEDLCRELAAEYEAEGRGFQLARVAGGWRYQTHPDQAPYVERFVLEGQTPSCPPPRWKPWPSSPTSSPSPGPRWARSGASAWTG
jgi:hypothetical protein